MRCIRLHLQGGRPAGQDVSVPACFSALCSLWSRKTRLPAFSILNGLVLQGKTSPRNTPQAAPKAAETTAGPQYALSSQLRAAPGRSSLSLHPAEERPRRDPAGLLHWSPLRTQTGHCWIKDGIRKRHCAENRSTGDSLSTPGLQGPGSKEEAAIVCAHQAIFQISSSLQSQGMEDQGQNDET